MDGVVLFLEKVVHYSAVVGIHVLEIAGIAVLLTTASKGIVMFIRKDPMLRLRLAEGTALALEFKLGSEVLRTVIVQGWNELAILGATILLRAALAILLHWEIHTEKHDIPSAMK